MKERRERRKIAWAIAASVFVHALVAYSLAAFSGVFTPPALADVEDKPPEMTLVDLTPAAPAERNPAFVETDPAHAAKEAPKEQTFVSNANSIAASNVPATGDAPLPSQNGRDQPFLNLNTQQYSEASKGANARPQPPAPAIPERSTPPPKQAPTATATATAKPSEPPKPTATPLPLASPEPQQLAMLRPTPPPPLNPAEETETAPPIAPAPTAPSVPRPEPQRPSSSYQAQKEQTKISGRITNRGSSSVNAVGTPLGQYQKTVYDAIGQRWYRRMKNNMDLVTIGTAHVSAEISPEGRIQNLKVLSNNANEAFANICLQSFEEAKLPPIPPDVVTLLPDGRMQVDISFTTY